MNPIEPDTQQSLSQRSSARAMACGAPFIEWVDLLVKLIADDIGMPNAEIDRTVETADQKLKGRIVPG